VQRETRIAARVSHALLRTAVRLAPPPAHRTNAGDMRPANFWKVCKVSARHPVIVISTVCTQAVGRGAVRKRAPAAPHRRGEGGARAMWDPPPVGYGLIDLTGQPPARGPPSAAPGAIGSPARRPVPPAHDAAASSPARDHRRMRPLRASDSGMTAVLAIREHAAVQEQQAHRRHHRRQLRQGHSPDSPDLAEGGDPDGGQTQEAAGADPGQGQLAVPEGEGHATLSDRSGAIHTMRQRANPTLAMERMASVLAG